MVLHKKDPKIAVRSFDSIDNAPEEKERGITIATAPCTFLIMKKRLKQSAKK